MPLNQQQAQKIDEWLKKHNIDYSCPFCKTKEFILAEIIAPPIIAPNGSITMGPGSTVPMVQLICKKCAHVSLFHSIPMGI